MLQRLLTAVFFAKFVATGLFLLGVSRWVCAGFFFGPDLFLFYQAFVPSAGALCSTRTRFRATAKEVWLTIDDGPDPADTPTILDLLKRYEARATFFVIGEKAGAHPELVRAMSAHGHEIGCHTQTHPAGTFWAASERRVAREIDQCLATLARCGVRPKWFRAPAGLKGLFLGDALRLRGLGCLGWSIRSGDCFARHTSTVSRRVLERLQPGDILLFHEGPSVRNSSVRVTALAQLLEGLHARGFRCVIPATPALAEFSGAPARPVSAAGSAALSPQEAATRPR